MINLFTSGENTCPYLTGIDDYQSGNLGSLILWSRQCCHLNPDQIFANISFENMRLRNMKTKTETPFQLYFAVILISLFIFKGFMHPLFFSCRPEEKQFSKQAVRMKILKKKIEDLGRWKIQRFYFSLNFRNISFMANLHLYLQLHPS